VPSSQQDSGRIIFVLCWVPVFGNDTVRVRSLGSSVFRSFPFLGRVAIVDGNTIRIFHQTPQTTLTQITQIIQRKHMMNNMILIPEELLCEIGPVCDDALSIASCSSFNEIVDEVLDGAPACIPSSISIFAKREMVTAVLPRQVTDSSLEGSLKMANMAKKNELPYAALKRFAKQQQSARPFKKQKTEGKNTTIFLVNNETRPVIQESDAKGNASLLHIACCSSSVTVREAAALLMMDPEAIRRPVDTQGESYKYPLNLAIHHNATLDVILLLLKADPTITSLRDGVESQGSLHILLGRQHYRRDILSLVDYFILARPSCAQIQDSHGCVPLHTAVFHQAELDTIRHLVMSYPEALQIQNRRHQTPLALAMECQCSLSTRISFGNGQ
jgi:hypothetical protein